MADFVYLSFVRLPSVSEGFFVLQIFRKGHLPRRGTGDPQTDSYCLQERAAEMETDRKNLEQMWKEEEKEREEKRKEAYAAYRRECRGREEGARRAAWEKLEKLLLEAGVASETVMRKASERWDSIAKPICGLGKLETAVSRIAGMTGKLSVTVNRPALVTMCGDHGVVAEGVTQTGKEVTRIVAENFAAKKACVTIMADVAGMDVFPVDMGMDTEHYPDKELRPFTLTDRKIARGTGNIAWEPAMTEEQCIRALLTGIGIVGELKEKGYDILAAGEMGIGNTTSASALTAAILCRDAKEVTGRGAGLSGEGLERKVAAVDRALRRYLAEKADREERENYEENGSDMVFCPEGVRLLASLGGYEIAGMAGMFLGGAVYRMPILADGFISSAAALAAVNILPAAADYLLASHQSKEPAGEMVLKALHADPFLCCDMCLGEGSGATAAIPILKMGAEVYHQMATFSDIHVKQYEHYEEGEGL